MTEAELWHMQLLAAANTFAGMDNVATIIFACLATAYFVGGKLSRSQAVLATVFFVIGATVSTVYALTEYRRSVYFLRELTENYGISAMLPNDVILPVGGIFLALLIPACVYFMYHVRSNAKTVESTS
jgi:TRAP-type mannitol/chloroaromatic compound transport system permease small subunit